MTFLLVRHTSLSHDVMSEHERIDEARIERDMAMRLDDILIKENTTEHDGVRETFEHPTYTVAEGLDTDLTYKGGRIWVYFDDCAVVITDDIMVVWHDPDRYQYLVRTDGNVKDVIMGVDPVASGWTDTNGKTLCPENAHKEGE